MAKRNVTEEDLLKALGHLEGAAEEDEQDDEVEKGEDDESDDESDEGSDEESDEESSDEAPPAKKGMTPPEWKNTKAANGGFTQKDNDDAEHFETGAEENDPTGSSRTLKSLVAGNDTLKKGFEVSAFLEALSDSVVEAVDGLSKSMGEAQQEQADFNNRVQKAIVAIGNAVLEIKQAVVKGGDAPVVARPRSVLNKSEVSERFEEAPAQQTEFSKSDVLDALTDMAMKGEIPPVVVSAYESGNGFLPPEYVGSVNQRLKAMAGRK